MADTFINKAKAEIFNGGLDVLTDTIRAMLLDQTGANPWSIDPDDDFVDGGGANDPLDAEYSGSGYTGGHGGAGRQALTSKTITEDDANDRAEFDCDPITFSSIGSGSEEASGLMMHREGTADDTDALLIAWNDSGGWPITTNGGDVTWTPGAEGILHLT